MVQLLLQIYKKEQVQYLVQAQLLNVGTDFGTGRVSGEDFGDEAGTSDFTGSFIGDGSGLTV